MESPVGFHVAKIEALHQNASPPLGVAASLSAAGTVWTVLETAGKYIASSPEAQALAHSIVTAIIDNIRARIGATTTPAA